MVMSKFTWNLVPNALSKTVLWYAGAGGFEFAFFPLGSLGGESNW